MNVLKAYTSGSRYPTRKVCCIAIADACTRIGVYEDDVLSRFAATSQLVTRSCRRLLDNSRIRQLAEAILGMWILNYCMQGLGLGLDFAYCQLGEKLHIII